MVLQFATVIVESKAAGFIRKFVVAVQLLPPDPTQVCPGSTGPTGCTAGALMPMPGGLSCASTAPEANRAAVIAKVKILVLVRIIYHSSKKSKLLYSLILSGDQKPVTPV
jgi:hypothetical protein